MLAALLVQHYPLIAVFTFAVVFVVTLLVLAIAFPEPSAFQYTVFRIVLALAAAGIAALIPGFMELNIATWLKAGGAMALFFPSFISIVPLSWL